MVILMMDYYPISMIFFFKSDGLSVLWQLRLWSFKLCDIKSDRFMTKNEKVQRKMPYEMKYVMKIMKFGNF